MELTIFVYNLNLWNNHEILLFGGLLMVRVPLVILQIEIMIKQDALSKNHGNFDQLRVNLNFKLHSYNQLARYFVIIVFMVGNNTLTIDILKRGSRRSIGLHIIEDGKLEVRAPYLMPKFFIDRFVASKRDWIIKTKQTMRNRKHVAKVAYHEGSVFRLAGVPYTLHITEGNTIVILGSRIFFPKKFLHHAKRHMELWIRSFTKKYLTTRLHFFAKTMNVSYKKISIRDTSSRWGSCSSTGTISFSYRLIFAEPPIIDYVVIHELAHTVHHNHAKVFWNLVSLYYPDYKAARAWLRHSGQTLKILI